MMVTVLEWLRVGLITGRQYEAYRCVLDFLTDPAEEPEHVCAACDWEEGERTEHTHRLLQDPGYFFFHGRDAFSRCMVFLAEG